MSRRPSAEALVSFAVVAASALFVFVALHPSKLFLRTTPAGGDMGAHVWAPDYLRHHLFPHGRITGWAPAWYDGFAALTFYFPLPYVVIALLSYVLPYGVAFKLVSVSGLVGLPVAAWAFGRLLRMRFPGPPLLALATVPYLFDRYWTIYGGNIASTLAGEFSFEISLCLALLFLGVFARCLDTGRYRGVAAVLLAATGLCHLLPTLFALVGAGLLFLLRPSRRRFGRAVTVGVVAGCVAAFWLVPFAFRLNLSNDMGWERTIVYLKNLFPWLNKSSDTPGIYTRHLKVVVALAAAGALGGLALRRRATLLITGLGLAAAAAFRLMPQGALWNARMLPFWYLCLYLAAAAGIAEAANAVGILLGRRPPAPVGAGTTPAEDEAFAAAEDDRALALVGAREEGTSGAGEGGVEADDAWDPDPHAQDGGAPISGGPEQPAGEQPAGGHGRSGEMGGAVGSGGAVRSGEGGPPPGRPWSLEPAEEDIVPSRIPPILIPLLIGLLVWLYVGQPIGAVPSWFPIKFGGAIGRDHNFVSDWANWNYSGYERKASYPEYRDVITTMARVGATYGCGRAMWEYESEEDRFGTPMALMLLPKWTHGCIDSMEGLFFESSATVPYHFLNQSELSKAGSDAMRGLPYQSLNVPDGIAHLRLLGVRYYMAISPEAQAQAHKTPGIHLIATTSRPYPVTYTVSGTQKVEQRLWEVYEIDGADPVAPLSYEPVVMTHAPVKSKTGWIDLSVPWYQNPSRWDVLLAASGPAEWKRVRGADPNPPRTPVTPVAVSNIRMTDDRIAFDVDRPGSPVLVKTSYFPNWQATGARGPWRVTPNLMVVIPTSTHVELHYGFTPVDNVGRVLTLAGLLAAGLLTRSDLAGPASKEDSGESAPAGEPADRGGGPASPADEDFDRELAVLLAGAPDAEGGGDPGPDAPR